MESMIAHDIVSVPRTEDVVLLDNVSFRDMFFSESIFKSLTENGFNKPSPIQFKAIPLARCGFDLIVQSKSGTGKTLVFVTTALESLDPSIKRVQTIVLTPTREIALQVTEVFKAVGSHIKDLKVETFIGGVPLPKDIAAVQSCQVAVGAPGRIRQLIELGHLKPDAVRLFVLDEADQLMAKTFQNEINFIYWSLSEFKQMLALSATYPEELVKFLGNYMRSGKLVTPETDPTPVLKGLKQFISLTRKHPDNLARLTDKENRLVSLLSMVKFNQCLIFSNYKSRAESTCNMLKCRGWSCEWISGGQAQDQRIRALTELRTGRCRILVTTDLTARGIDSKGINLVINMDTPYDPRIYLHRMGRAGRYGSQGVVITILSRGSDLDNFLQMLGLIDMKLPVKVIPPGDEDYDLWSDESSNFDELYGIESTPESIQRYKSQFASTEPSKPSEPNKKNKKPHKGENTNKDNSENISNKNKPPPDMNERNFPSIHNKKTSLNDYFLDESVPGEFLSLSSLKESLKGFEIKNEGDKSQTVNGNKVIENGETVEIKQNGVDKLPKENKNLPPREKSNCKGREDKKLNHVIENNEIVKLKEKQSVVRSVSNGNEQVKSVVNNVANQAVRRFSYSDIARGKRVECKPVDLKPEEIKNLKKSPLKLFPSEKVSNKIEGVSISDKAIDGFSKRMYSSVLKESKGKQETNNSSLSAGKSNIVTTVKNNSGEPSENSNQVEKPSSKSIVYFNPPKQISKMLCGVLFPPGQSNSESGTTEISESSDSKLAQNDVNTANIAKRKAEVLIDAHNKSNPSFNAKHCVDNSKTVQDSDSTDYSDSEGEYVITGSFTKDCSFSRSQQLSQSLVNSCLQQVNRSAVEPRSHKINRSVTEIETYKKNQTLTEPPSRKIKQRSNQMNRSVTENKPFGFKEWFELYHQQSSLIYNYVKYSKEFQYNYNFY